jgi:hypothetical protein
MPISSIDPALFAAFALTAIILSLKALLLGAATAAMRGKLKSFLIAEDAAWLDGAHVDTDPEIVARIGRAHRNDLICCSSPSVASFIYSPVVRPWRVSSIAAPFWSLEHYTPSRISAGSQCSAETLIPLASWSSRR